MKQSMTPNSKAILLAQTGLALAFFLAGIGPAAAQPAPSPVSVSAPPATQGAAESIDATIPGAPVPSAPSAAASPATPAPVAVPPAAASAATPAPVAAPAAQQTLPAASKAEIAAQPSPADLAVAHSPASPPSEKTPDKAAKAEKTASEKEHDAAKDSGSGAVKNGLKVTDILATPANIRPLPQQYLVVKKEHNANDIDARLTAARSALAQGNYQSALELFDGLYRKNPRDMRMIMGRAVALQRLGQNDEAMEAYQVALRTDPHNIEALTNVLGLLRGKDAPTALKKLQQLRDLYPANADVTAQLGMVYGVAGDYTNAVKYLDMADALKPGNPTVLYNKAVAYDHMGNSTRAAELYRQILLIASDGDLDQSFPLEAVRQRLATLH